MQDNLIPATKKMEKANQNFRPILGLLPVVLFSLLIIRSELKVERCSGMADALVFVFLYGGLIIALITGLIIQLKKLSNGIDISIRKFNLVVMVICSATAFWLTYLDEDYFQERTILKAEMVGGLDIGRLVLREKNYFSAKFGHIDWTCTISGIYEINKDTLFLGPRISNESHNIIASKYLIHYNGYFVPIDSSAQSIDSARWLKISEIK